MAFIETHPFPDWKGPEHQQPKPFEIYSYNSTLQVWQDERGWHIEGTVNNNGQVEQIRESGTYADITEKLAVIYTKHLSSTPKSAVAQR